MKANKLFNGTASLEKMIQEKMGIITALKEAQEEEDFDWLTYPE